MSNSQSTPSKTESIILEVFGDPISGFPEGALPCERDIVAYYFWLANLQKGDSPSSKILQDDKTAIYWVITNKLMVHWRDENPDVILMKKEEVKEKIRNFIVNKALPVKKKTGLLKEDQIVNRMKEWLKFEPIFDIAKKTKTSDSSQVTKITFYIFKIFLLFFSIFLQLLCYF